MNKIKPMLARLEARPWNDANWIWEPKFDGERAIIDTRTGVIQSRSGKDKTAFFPEIRPRTIRPAILDGEIVVYINGRTDFNAIQHRTTDSDIKFRMNQYPASYEVFDILELDGQSTLSLPLSERKRLLNAVIIEDEHLHLTPYTQDGLDLMDKAINQQWEGIIGKPMPMPYLQGRRDWVKVKITQTDTFTVCGYTTGTGWRAASFGALVLGKTANGHLKYVGEVGTGFTEGDIEQLITSLKHLVTARCPFNVNPYNGQQPTWVQPMIQVVVRYLEYTNTGILRFPAFKGVV